MIKRLNPNAIVPSSDTVRNQIDKLYENEKKGYKRITRSSWLHFFYFGWLDLKKLNFFSWNYSTLDLFKLGIKAYGFRFLST
jgi:hypothetical protein